MSFRTPQHPGEVRTVLEAGYARYAMGIDMFPKVRLRSDADNLPKKSQAIGRALQSAWSRIDEDEAYFRDAMLHVADLAAAKVEAQEFDDGAMLVLTQVGRNCVKMANILPEPGRPSATIGVFSRAEFIEEFEGFEFNITGNRTLKLVDSKMQIGGDGPDYAILRSSNVSCVFLPQTA